MLLFTWNETSLTTRFFPSYECERPLIDIASEESFPALPASTVILPAADFQKLASAATYKEISKQCNCAVMLFQTYMSQRRFFFSD
jgi:hypothetical protein